MAYHVKQGCVGEEGSSPVYVAMGVGFKIGRGRCSNTDDGLHDGVNMQEIRPANSQEVVSRLTHRKQHDRL